MLEQTGRETVFIELSNALCIHMAVAPRPDKVINNPDNYLHACSTERECFFSESFWLNLRIICYFIQSIPEPDLEGAKSGKTTFLPLDLAHQRTYIICGIYNVQCIFDNTY